MPPLEEFIRRLEAEFGEPIPPEPDSLWLTEAVLIVESWGYVLADEMIADIADISDLHHYASQVGPLLGERRGAEDPPSSA